MVNKRKRRAVSESSSGSEFQQGASGGAATDESDGEGPSTITSSSKRRLRRTRASKPVLKDSDSEKEVKQKGNYYNKQDESEEEDNRGPPVTPSPRKRGPPKFVSLDTDSDSPSPSPSKKRKVAGTSASVPTTPSSSPRKPTKKNGGGTPSPKKKPKPPVQPEEMWRRSDIPRGLQITKGNAQKLFRLKAEDLNASGIHFERQSRGRLQGEMHLYDMKEVERVAWKKHGGPDGFAVMIENAKESWINRGNDPFRFLHVPYPFRYSRSTRCKGCGSIFQVPTHLTFDKCEPCRGIIRPIPTVIVGSLNPLDCLDIMGLGDDSDGPYEMDYEDYEDYDDEP